LIDVVFIPCVIFWIIIRCESVPARAAGEAGQCYCLCVMGIKRVCFYGHCVGIKAQINEECSLICLEGGYEAVTCASVFIDAVAEGD